MNSIITNGNVLGVVFSFLDIQSLGRLAQVNKCGIDRVLNEKVKGYDIWSVPVSENGNTLIIIDSLNVMALYGIIKTHKDPKIPDKLKSDVDYNVCMCGLEIYRTDPTLSDICSRTPTLLNAHNLSFLIEKELVSFNVISLPRQLSVSMLAGFAHGVVIMVNVTEADWRDQLTSVWTNLSAIPNLHPLLLYSNDEVVAFPLMSQIKNAGTVMKIGIVTRDVLKEFYGTLGRICKQNKTAMDAAPKSQSEVTTNPGKGAEEGVKTKKCSLMCW